MPASHTTSLLNAGTVTFWKVIVMRTAKRDPVRRLLRINETINPQTLPGTDVYAFPCEACRQGGPEVLRMARVPVPPLMFGV